MNIKPVFDRLVIERVEQKDTTESGRIIIPDDAKAPAQLGRVVAVGQGRNYDGPGEVAVYCAGGSDGAHADYVLKFRRPAMVVTVGDLVIYGKYSGSEVELDGKKVFILREDEVLGIVEEEAANETAGPAATPEEAPVH